MAPMQLRIKHKMTDRFLMRDMGALQHGGEEKASIVRFVIVRFVKAK